MRASRTATSLSLDAPPSEPLLLQTPLSSEVRGTPKPPQVGITVSPSSQGWHLNPSWQQPDWGLSPI